MSTLNVYASKATDNLSEITMGPRTGYTSRMEQILYLDFSTTPITTFIAGERLVVRFFGRAVITARVEFNEQQVTLTSVQTVIGDLPITVTKPAGDSAESRNAGLEAATLLLLDHADRVVRRLLNTRVNQTNAWDQPSEWDKHDMRRVLAALPLPKTSKDPAEANAIYLLRKYSGEFDA